MSVSCVVANQVSVTLGLALPVLHCSMYSLKIVYAYSVSVALHKKDYLYDRHVLIVWCVQIMT